MNPPCCFQQIFYLNHMRTQHAVALLCQFNQRSPLSGQVSNCVLILAIHLNNSNHSEPTLNLFYVHEMIPVVQEFVWCIKVDKIGLYKLWDYPALRQTKSLYWIKATILLWIKS